MRTLIFGSGVLGSYYGARLAASGHDVTMLARGNRLREIEEHGVVVIDEGTGQHLRLRIPVTETLDPGDRYDVIAVFVRAEQVGEALPALTANTATPTVLFMNNMVSGVDRLSEAVGPGRVMLGFPGAAGGKAGYVVRARTVHPWLQRTTVGELDGRRSTRAVRIAGALRAAGFPSAVSGDMDAWLKTHAALVCPIANAYYMAGDDMQRLARTRDALVLASRAIREGFRMLRSAGWQVTPPHLALALAVPEPLLVPILARAARAPYADFIVARHAAVAREEIGVLSSQLVALSRAAGVPMPSLEVLASYARTGVRPARAGSHVLPVRWGGIVGISLAALAAGALRALLRER